MTAFNFNSLTGLLDLVNSTEPLYLTASDGSVWQVTVNTSGNLVTTLISAAPTTGANHGIPIGLWNLGVTYP